jgi:hypothetical protein
MHGLLKQPGYRLHPPDSPHARTLLAEQGLGPADLDRALAHLERAEGTKVGTIVGINEDGVFGTGREGWRPDLPDACHEPFIPLLWLKIHELLGRVPEGTRIPPCSLRSDRSARLSACADCARTGAGSRSATARSGRRARPARRSAVRRSSANLVVRTWVRT